MFSLFFTSSFLLVTINCLPPPSYLKACSLTKDFEKCAIKSAETFIPGFIHGDKQFGIPSIDPLQLTLLTISPGDNLHLILTNITIVGLKDSKLTDIKYNKNTGHLTIAVEIPSASLTSKYVVDGQLLVFPVTGNGDFKLEIDGGKAKFDVDIIPHEVDGEVYSIVKNDHLDLKMENGKVNFDNLFNGDPVLGPQVNKFINENWDEVYKDLDEGIKAPISAVCRLLFQNWFTKIPLKDLFLE